MPIKARGQEEGGGTPAPPCLNVSGPWYQNNRQIKCSSLPLHARLGNAPKGALFSLGGGVHYFSCVVLGCQYA